MVAELVRSMLSVSRLQKVMWEQTCETAVIVISRIGKTSFIGKYPLDTWKGHVLKNLNHLRVFGTECYAYIPQQFQKKFDNKSLFGLMMCYLNDNDGYQVYVPFPSRLCTRISFSRQNEFAPVQWLKRG
jgi:hypothetical protein